MAHFPKQATDKNIIKSSFKISRDIQKKDDGPDRDHITVNLVIMSLQCLLATDFSSVEINS